jgi:hypothetical protein
MSGRYSIGRVANSNDLPRLQRKVEDLYNNYNVSVTTQIISLIFFTLVLSLNKNRDSRIASG